MSLDIALRIAAPCLVGNHDRCRGIVRSLAGDRECECPIIDVHEHGHDLAGQGKQRKSAATGLAHPV